MKQNQQSLLALKREHLSFYEPAGFFMLRAPTISTDISFSLSVSANGLGEQAKRSESDEQLQRLFADVVQQTNDKLTALLSQPEVMQALMIASPALIDGLAHLRQRPSPRQKARVFASILRYIVRMSTRPTPFGLFAGVSIGTLANETTAQIAVPTVQRTRTQGDIKRLLKIVKTVEQDSRFIQHLCVAVNQSVSTIGSRAVVPFTDADDQGNMRAITLQITPLVKSILEMTHHPIAYRDVQRHLLLTFPALQEQQVDQVMQKLLSHSFLFSDLRPPLLEKNPADYVLEHLQSVPGTQSFSDQIRHEIMYARMMDNQCWRGSEQLLRQTEQQEAFRKNTDRIYYVDTLLNLEKPLLNKTIGDAVAQIAEVLLRIAPGSPISPLAQYHTAFVERYGMDAEVPLLTLLSSEVGLGTPFAYSSRAHEDKEEYVLISSQQQQRNAILTSLLAEALRGRARQVELSDDVLDQLAQCLPEASHLPYAALEMYVQVHAASREALDRGDWRMVVMSPPTFLPGGRTFGRFSSLMEEEQLRALKDYTRREEMLFPDVIFAELSYLFCFEHDMNVMLRPRLHSYEISVNTMPSVAPDKVIDLHDLVVGVRSDRFYLRSVRLGKEVRVCQSHALNTERTPMVCRFLLDVSWNGYTGIPGFDWGCVRGSPYLPRVVYKNAIFAPAQWRFQRSHVLLKSGHDEDICWFHRVQQWRQQWEVPRYVSLVEADKRFLLDLEHPSFLAELRHALLKTRPNESVLLQEAFLDAQDLWLRDTTGSPYTSELVVPLIPRQATVNATPKKPATRQFNYAHPVVSYQDRTQLPGSAWTSLKLYTTIKRQNAIIIGPMREIVHTLQQHSLSDYWFFVRYADPDPHLRLRFHTSDPQQQDQLLTTALSWSRTLFQEALVKRVVVDEYSREIERYGGPAALELIERVFCASSQIASDILSAQSSGQITFNPIATAVWSLDLFFTAWGLTLQERLNFVAKRVEKYSTPSLYRSLRGQLSELLTPTTLDGPEHGNRQRELLHSISNTQALLIREALQHLHALTACGELWQLEEYVLSSIAHMHLNRLQGRSQEQEKQVYACWKHTLESLCYRVHSRPPRR
ncbi:MAG TPA: lantibiotic dehydratase [Ktedonobacteraceae bacterium]|nr:lantibiotic dehydratase [Ktedonobacteraceae bacterium]